MIQQAVTKLVQYALATKLIENEDAVWAANRLLALLPEDVLSQEAEKAILSWDPSGEGEREPLAGILSSLCDDALQRGLIEEDTVTQRDLRSEEHTSELQSRI